MFTFKKITPADKDAVLKISSKIWEGSDYIHNVFDRWTTDDEGEFTAVLRDGVIVGFSRLTWLTPTDVWLEGLRADPDANVKGIGRRLSLYYLGRLKKRTDLSSIRFATYYQNKASIITTERLGFQVEHVMSNKVLAFDDKDIEEYRAKPLPENIFCDGISLQELERYTKSSQFLKDSRDFLCLGWVCYKYSDHIADKFFYNPKQYIAYKTDDDLTGLLLYDIKNSMNKKPACNICFIDAQSPEIAEELFKTVKIITAQKGIGILETKLPTEKRYLQPLEAAGFESWEQENDFLIYGYPLPFDAPVKG